MLYTFIPKLLPIVWETDAWQKITDIPHIYLLTSTISKKGCLKVIKVLKGKKVNKGNLF